jgi:hypothetical protein
MDFRITLTKLATMLQGIGYSEGTYDIVSVAGSAKDCLSASPEEVAYLFKQIELSSRLHCVSEVVILLHDNCGAYGIADAHQEHETETSDLDKIVNLINQKFPQLKVKAYIIQGTATGLFHLELCKY